MNQMPRKKTEKAPEPAPEPETIQTIPEMEEELGVKNREKEVLQVKVNITRGLYDFYKEQAADAAMPASALLSLALREYANEHLIEVYIPDGQ